MGRFIVYGLIGAVVGLILGLAFGGIGGAIVGAIICLVVGCAIALMMNRNTSPDDPFVTETNVDNYMEAVSYKTAGLPSGNQNWISSTIRSILESWR